MGRDDDFQLLRRVAAIQREGPLPLDQLARELGMSPSLLSRNMKPLVEEGLIARQQRSTRAGREVLYVPQPFVRVQWISATGEAASWTTIGDTDWSAPLVSRIADEASRATLLRFISVLRAGRRLRPSKVPATSDAFAEPAVALIVYGSAATDESRPDSDVDVLAVTTRPDDEEEILDAAADATVLSSKPLQVKAIPVGELGRLSRVISQAIRDHGIVVFDGLREPALYEWLHARRRARGSSRRGERVARGGRD